MNKSKKKKKNEKYLSVMSSQPGSYKIWVLAVTVLDYVDKTLAFGLFEKIFGGMTDWRMVVTEGSTSK